MTSGGSSAMEGIRQSNTSTSRVVSNYDITDDRVVFIKQL
jgi:hypothetical protein